MFWKIILFVLAAGSWIGVFACITDLVNTSTTSGWIPTEATVLQYKASQVNLQKYPPTFRLDIKYEYTFGGTIYTGTRVGLRDRVYNGTSKVKLLGSSNPSSITVYVNPRDPNSAVIDRGNWLYRVLLLFVGLVIAVVVSLLFYYSIRPMWQDKTAVVPL